LAKKRLGYFWLNWGFSPISEKTPSRMGFIKFYSLYFMKINCSKWEIDFFKIILFLTKWKLINFS
jgi:hypothetical protein